MERFATLSIGAGKPFDPKAFAPEITQVITDGMADAAKGELPPVNAFWSVTMYEMPASLLHANPLTRYLINSPMLPTLKQDADGGLTIYIQAESPGQDRDSNWLPAPKGPFSLAVRLYAPKSEAYDGTWKLPPLRQASA